MSSASRLARDFAAAYPQAFAAQLESGNAAEIEDVLEGLPERAAVGVLGAMSSTAGSPVLTSVFRRIADELTLEDADAAAAFLSRLSVPARRELIGIVKDAHLRRRLRQRLNYPSHTLGAVMIEPTMIVMADSRTGVLLDALRTHSTEREPSIVAVDDEGLYAGVVSLWKLLAAHNPDRKISGCIDPRPPLQAEMAIADVAEPSKWHGVHWLPVVDFDNRVVGVVERDDLLDRIGSKGSGPNLVTDAATDLATRFLIVLRDVLSRGLGGWSAR